MSSDNTQQSHRTSNATVTGASAAIAGASTAVVGAIVGPAPRLTGTNTMQPISLFWLQIVAVLTGRLA